MSAELTAFYRKCLDEDEAAAKTADPDFRYVMSRAPTLPGVAAQVAVEDHMRLHDPARVLREVEADRKLLAAYERADHGSIVWDVLGFAVTIRAAVFRDRPGYEHEWSP